MRTGIAAGLLAVAAQAAGAETYRGNELPPYRVEAAEGTRELRSYGPHLLAEVTVAGNRAQAASAGFRVLAGYIFGGNADDAKIAMTVPVAQVPQADGATWTVTFMMPRAWTQDSLPAPDDTRIRLVADPGGRQVVERFSGLPREDEMFARADSLRDWALAQGLEVTGGPRFYLYDSPMTLPWNRRNEVALPVR